MAGDRRVPRRPREVTPAGIAAERTSRLALPYARDPSWNRTIAAGSGAHTANPDKTPDSRYAGCQTGEQVRCLTSNAHRAILGPLGEDPTVSAAPSTTSAGSLTPWPRFDGWRAIPVTPQSSRSPLFGWFRLGVAGDQPRGAPAPVVALLTAGGRARREEFMYTPSCIENGSNLCRREATCHGKLRAGGGGRGGVAMLCFARRDSWRSWPWLPGSRQPVKRERRRV